MVGLHSRSFRNGDTLKTAAGRRFMLDKHSEQKQGWGLKFLLLQSNHYQLKGNGGRGIGCSVCICEHTCVCVYEISSYLLPPWLLLHLKVKVDLGIG